MATKKPTKPVEKKKAAANKPALTKEQLASKKKLVKKVATSGDPLKRIPVDKLLAADEAPPVPKAPSPWENAPAAHPVAPKPSEALVQMKVEEVISFAPKKPAGLNFNDIVRPPQPTAPLEAAKTGMLKLSDLFKK